MKRRIELNEEQLTFLYDLVRSSIDTEDVWLVDIRHTEHADDVRDILKREYEEVHGPSS